ncbi:2-oxoacid:acceptor oxidoreductase family protein [Desulfonatronospira sp.]|uniref:2-oxoacid:acceptor oxidoreductase family protein n=1 Tax=Desulfonatronospira sp. TaxID=1962951 RepID=UPI0025BE9C81|nr:2-oxoacid:acceptor oxidoreductase family protein [Desulfonatronospira sp.]
MSVYQDVIIAGFGGQGVMLMGNLLAVSAMQSGLHVTYIPVYGPEMRGGTANCTVVISDQEVGSPIVKSPVTLIAMNRPSMEKFQPRVKQGGTVVFNASQVEPGLADSSLYTRGIKANDIANDLGNPRLANMVALGAYIEATGIVPLQAVKDSLPRVIPERYHNLLPQNAQALEAGVAGVKKD